MSTPSLGPIVPRSYDDYARIPPDLNRWELIDGEFFRSPAPTSFHQRIVTQLVMLLGQQVDEPGIARVLVSPCDLILSRNNTVQPDLMVIRTDRIGLVTERGVEGSPDLVVEVLSKSTAIQDRTVKRSLYAKFGVPEYWLVDPDAQSVEILVLGQGAYAQHVVFARPDVLRSPQFASVTFPVEKLFAPLG